MLAYINLQTHCYLKVRCLFYQNLGALFSVRAVCQPQTENIVSIIIVLTAMYRYVSSGYLLTIHWYKGNDAILNFHFCHICVLLCTSSKSYFTLLILSQRYFKTENNNVDTIVIIAKKCKISIDHPTIEKLYKFHYLFINLHPLYTQKNEKKKIVWPISIQ